MKLTLLGTGSFFIEKNKSASSFLLEVVGKKILIDCGPGTLMRLAEHGVKPEELDYILITHFHADHTSDLYPLFMRCRLDDFFTPDKYPKYPEILGPKGIYEFMNNCANNYRLVTFTSWEGIKVKDISTPTNFDQFKITPVKVEHRAFGMDAGGQAYRIESEGKIIVFSGDSNRNPQIVEAARNANVFVCDTSEKVGNSNPAHMDTKDVGEVCTKAGVKKVILTHLYPETEKVDVVKEVKDYFNGEVVKGEDGMEIGI